ncbi:hypothetical protein EVAR_8320_1 [Eumeta japonica]|uniref:Uncharacterized protein n=1 Tax=Eumeta variegata TaxID=151549 RepID=A0A4C1VE24_EUMVA|nr:hypothetical protein EVAR_8320_1 [Eumeta japonica]
MRDRDGCAGTPAPRLRCRPPHTPATVQCRGGLILSFQQYFVMCLKCVDAGFVIVILRDVFIFVSGASLGYDTVQSAGHQQITEMCMYDVFKSVYQSHGPCLRARVHTCGVGVRRGHAHIQRAVEPSSCFFFSSAAGWRCPRARHTTAPRQGRAVGRPLPRG